MCLLVLNVYLWLVLFQEEGFLCLTLVHPAFLDHDGMGPENVFDVAKWRSRCQFLIDGVGKFVPDDPEKDENIYEMIDSFEQMTDIP
uniref:Protein kinase domain-containing protein n=1 Tax=Panagrellus redivivus TaxID=6233 RepID=A0A7E4VBG8_PANRE